MSEIFQIRKGMWAKYKGKVGIVNDFNPMPNRVVRHTAIGNIEIPGNSANFHITDKDGFTTEEITIDLSDLKECYQEEIPMRKGTNKTTIKNRYNSKRG